MAPNVHIMSFPPESCRRRLSMRTLLTLLSCFALIASVNAGSSNSLMDVTPDGKTLLVANRDNGSVTVVDIASRKPVKQIAVGEHPEGVSWIGNGPLALV